jgi:hypothetical protein
MLLFFSLKIFRSSALSARFKQVLDLRIAHDRFGSSSDPYPNNIDRSLNETTDDKIRKYRVDYNTNLFLATSGVQFTQTDRGQFHFRRETFTQYLKSRVVLTLTKETTLRITLTLDGSPITSKSHTHPSHSQTSRLSTSSLSLGVPVPRTTQCM